MGGNRSGARSRGLLVAAALTIGAAAFAAVGRGGGERPLVASAVDEAPDGQRGESTFANGDTAGGGETRRALAPEEYRPTPVPDLPDDVPPTRVLDWIDDLRDDDVRGNAIDAYIALVRTGPAVIPWVRPALRSGDEQQRLIAARVLRELDDGPSDALLAACIESLSTATVRMDHARNDCAGAFDYLLRYADLARARLEAALVSSDARQAFLSACLLASTGRTDSPHRTITMLIERLHDNDITGDAVLSAHSLYRLGPEVLPHLHQAWVRADPQAQQLLRLIDLDLREPPRTKQQLHARSAMHDVTDLYHDPVLQYDARRSWLPLD